MLVEPVHTETGLPLRLRTMKLLCISFALRRALLKLLILALAMACSLAAPVSSSP
ncbi:hypothetical protein D3C72_2040470 [compost metagenome]